MKEQEDKFDVDPDWVMPQVTDLVPEGGSLEQQLRKLSSTYFDTSGSGLRLFGITLRRRVGGSETGWQLKVPNGTYRTELQSGSRAKTLPSALAEGVAGLLAGESLEPVATIVTTRTAYRILNADGKLVVEIADDQVESGPPDGESMLHSWREVEVELGPGGTKKDLKRARKLLLTAGASPSISRTKLDHALAPASPDGQAATVESGTVGELVAAYVTAQCDVLASNDVGMRTGTPAVHKTRVAVRRLRSTLRVFDDVVERHLPRNSTTSWCGTPTYLAGFAIRTFSAAGWPSNLPNCRHSSVAGRSRPRSPRLWRRNVRRRWRA